MEQFEKIMERLKPELDAMNENIARSLATGNGMMNTIVTQYLQTKGKQIRPLMVLLAAKMFGGVTPKVIDAAASIEMLHNATLIHDDVVDETDRRRGAPTLNFRWGNHIAVLVGDYFVTTSLAAGIRTGNLRVIASLSALGAELSLGEIDQICNVREHKLDREAYFAMIRQKTASLFRNCVAIGADTAGASEDEAAPLVEYAEMLGLCFQIRDDIFDYFDSAQIGKPTGNDLREGKVTLPLICALEAAPAKETARITALLKRGDLTDAEIASLIDFAKANGGIEAAYAAMRDIQARADRLIDAYPDSEWKSAFRSIFDYIIARTH